VEVEVKAQYSTGMGVNYAPKGFHFITLSIDELLFEDGQSIR
jgi:coenzyme F420-reducing hydrogenase alpha subunit